MIVIFIRYIGGSIIKEVTIRVAEKDMEFAQGLENLGMKRTVACVITFLKDQNERFFREIEKATRLSQPEISKAMQILREKGWLNEHYIESKGEGRRLRIYALKATVDEIINYYEAEKCRESVRAMESIQKLKRIKLRINQKVISPS
jgi:predicted transcriptional regulator